MTSMTLIAAPMTRLPFARSTLLRAGGKCAEAALVRDAIAGDDEAFGTLVRKHYERAIAVAQKIVGSREEAQDIVQDAFVRAHRRLADFQGQSGFYTWLYRIVANLSIDSLRRRKRERRADIEQEEVREALRTDGDNTLWARFDDTNPGVNAERTQLRLRLQQAFDQLAEIHRDVIVLREVQGQSYEEIAVILGIKKGTVMSRLFHARRAMQDGLQSRVKPQMQ